MTSTMAVKLKWLRVIQSFKEMTANMEIGFSISEPQNRHFKRMERQLIMGWQLYYRI